MLTSRQIRYEQCTEIDFDNLCPLGLGSRGFPPARLLSSKGYDPFSWTKFLADLGGPKNPPSNRRGRIFLLSSTEQVLSPLLRRGFNLGSDGLGDSAQR